MRKSILLLIAILLIVGVIPSLDEITVAQGETYRVPIVGTYEISRTDCIGHSGVGRYIDINLPSDNDNWAINIRLVFI